MKKNLKPVIAVKDGETKNFDSITECAKELGVTPASVSISIRKNWKVKGYVVSKAA